MSYLPWICLGIGVCGALWWTHAIIVERYRRRLEDRQRLDPVLVERALDAFVEFGPRARGSGLEGGMEAAIRVVFDELRPTLDDAASLLRELADDLKRFYEPEKGWPPHIEAVELVCADLGRPVEQGDADA